MKDLLQEHHTLSSLRSLMWAYGSPSIVTSANDNRWQSDEWCSWRALELAGVLEKPDLARKLDDFLDSENDHRLGARFERLIEFGLPLLPGTECVERRLQVHQNKQTRGEFDFIVRDTVSGDLEHWEVACKFYLGVSSQRASEAGKLNWVGPGKRDSLVRKLKHLTQKQLVLSSMPDAQATVDTLEDKIKRVRAVLKGRLFYPLAPSHEHDSDFEFESEHGAIRLNAQSPFGYWCDINQLVSANPKAIYPLSKPQWLDPSTDRRDTLDVDKLSGQIENTPQCVDVVTGEGQLQRWFIVAPGWFDDLNPEAIS